MRYKTEQQQYRVKELGIIISLVIALCANNIYFVLFKITFSLIDYYFMKN